MVPSPSSYPSTLSPHSCVVTGVWLTWLHRMRGILVSRFITNLRHVFSERAEGDSRPLSTLKVRVPIISSVDIVGNLGAPLRSSPISGLRFSSHSGSSHQCKSRVSADSLVDEDVDDLDDPDLEYTEITSCRPMLVGLGIDRDVVGEGSGMPVWRKEPDGRDVHSNLNEGEAGGHCRLTGSRRTPPEVKGTPCWLGGTMKVWIGIRGIGWGPSPWRRR